MLGGLICLTLKNTGGCSELLQRDGSSLIVDYSMDEELEWARGDFLKLRDYDEILECVQQHHDKMRRVCMQRCPFLQNAVMFVQND